MAKRKSSKKVQKRQKAQPPPQDPQEQDQPDPKEALPLPRFPRLRLSQLPGPLSFRLAGGRLKDED